VISALIGIPGIGAWTVSVLLIFNFGRLDVMPVSDQGIRCGAQLVYWVENPATPKQVQEKKRNSGDLIATSHRSICGRRRN
jgi:DNA-3-methyladenine glycosylase II